jgi:lysophospholipase L1-like esterase
MLNDMSRRAVVHVALAVGGIAAGIALLVAAELTLRMLDIGSDTPVFEPAVGADGAPIMRLAWNPQFAKPQPVQPHREFPLHKSPGTFRIFVIGESSAEGAPYGTDLAFSTWLARRLEAQAADVHWEVVNAALVGAQSWSMLTVVHDIARYQPDLLVVYLGHNEVGTRFSAYQRRWLDPRRFSLRALLTKTRLYRLLSPVLPAPPANRQLDLRNVHRPGEAFAVVPPGGARVYASAADRSISAALYRTRLEEMIRTIRAAGGHTMLLTLSQNFSEWEPAVSIHRPGMRPQDKVAWRSAVRAGDALAAHDCAAALAAWQRALALDDGYAGLQFKMAGCERALGRLEEARARFRLASDLDRLPQGASTSFNDILRDVAQHEGAILVDVDLVLSQASGPRLVGDDLFVDAMHPSVRAHQLIAQAVANAIRETGLAGPAVHWRNADYVDPDPDEAVLALDPELPTKVLLTRALAHQAAGRTRDALRTLQEAARQTHDAGTRSMLEQAIRTADGTP